MTTQSKPAGFNPDTDLLLERCRCPWRRSGPRGRSLSCWCNGSRLAPWSTASVDIELKPGGKFNSVMRSPEDQLFSQQRVPAGNRAATQTRFHQLHD